MIRRIGLLLLSLLLVLVAAPDAAAKSWWGWLEEFSGPGPFRTRGPLQTLHFTAMCAAEDEVDYHALDAATDLVAANVNQYITTVLTPLLLKLNMPGPFPAIEPTPPAILVPPGVEFLMLTPSSGTPFGAITQPAVPPAGIGAQPGNAPQPPNPAQPADGLVRLQGAGVTGQTPSSPARRELLIAETVIKRSRQKLGTPLPFQSVQAEGISARLRAQGVTRALAKPRLSRDYCVYVDYGRFFADADPIQGYPAIRASKLDVGLSYVIIGPLDISAAAGFLRFSPEQTPSVFRWTFTPFRLQVRPLAWVEKYAPNDGLGRRLARLAYAPKLYVKQTALLRSISASEFGSRMLQPDGTEFKTGPELVSSYGFAFDLTEVAAALFTSD